MSIYQQSTLLNVQDDATQTERASKVRFKQQLFASIGGGMIFALVGVVTTALLNGGGAIFGGLITGAAASAVGIGAVAAIGLTCVFFAAKYLSKAVSLDQDSQAKKINAATKGRGPAISPTPDIQTTKPMGVPFGLGAAGLTEKELQNDTPDTMVSNVMAHEKLAAMESPSRAIH